MAQWWIIIHAPNGTAYTWPAGDNPGDDELNAARTLVGFPANDDWVDDDSGWQIMLTGGEPHQTLMDRAIVGDLRKADPAAVAAHAETRRQGYIVRRSAAVKAALLALDDAALAALLADPAVADRVVVKPKGG